MGNHQHTARIGAHPQTKAATTKKDLTRKVFLIQLMVVGVGYLLYAMNRSAFPIGLASLGKTLGFGAQQLGILATIFLLGQTLVDIPAGLWASGHGHAGVSRRMNKMMAFGTAGAGLTSILLAFLALNFPLTILYRVLFGVSEGVFNICVYAFAGSALPQRRAFLNTVMGFFYAAGSVIGPTVFSRIIDASSPNRGWRIGLLAFGLVTIVVAVVLFVVMSTTLGKLARDLPALETESVKPEGTMEALRDVIRRGSMWKGLSIHAVNLISYWEFSGLMPSFLIQYQHKSVSVVGLLFGLGFGMTSLVSPLIGLVADRFGRQVVVITLGVVDAIGLYLLLNHPTSNAATMAIVFVVGVGLNTLYFTGYTLAQDGVPNDRVAIATGFAGAVGYLVASCAGPISGWLTTVWDYRFAGAIELVLPQVIIVSLAIAFLPGPKAWAQLKKDGPLI